MYDVMLDEASLWLNEHEPPLRKQKLGAPPSPVEDLYFSDEEDMSPEEREKYRLQVVESCGFDVDFFKHTFNGIMPSGCCPYDTLFAKAGLHCYNLEKGKNLQFKTVVKVNAEIGSLYNSYSTSEVMDPVNNSLHTFQTLVTDAGKMNKARLILVTKICRIKPQVPDVFYKGDMPNWPLNDAFIKGDKLLQFYEVKESELRDNEWLYLYAEAALFSEWHSDMSVPFEMKKVVVQTKEDVESSMKLKSSNAIFYMSFKVGEGPDCRGIVRKTSDGRTGHMCLEARCWIDK
ncbi:hypothetical protein ARALYDRAFT_903306 [Arabidopsis lyrata subsp. lyrata]|uniref:Uncharacterized protein n=1 Tax=Arabidopsis lyrata subsp. lyrata TaxID=81972 RepID=D7LEH8_ARALL|nr:hypothetical protein ARALYDRAFT_903306 [Arabidopsis lyrata subsp. lyrata]